MFAEVGRSSGVSMRFAHEDKQAHLNSHTFFLSYEGPLPATARPKEVKVDMTIMEEIVFPLDVSVGLKVGHFVGQDESASRLPDDICLPLDW